jgi:hypothetical protein
MKKIFTIILSVVIGLNLSVKVWGQVNILVGCTSNETNNGELIEKDKKIIVLEKQLKDKELEIADKDQKIQELEKVINESPSTSLLSKIIDIIDLIKSGDMAGLSQHVHPTKGVRFTPYPYIDIQHDQVFTPQEVAGLMQNNQVLNWGNFDGSGEPIDLKFIDYYNTFVYDKDFANPHMIGNNIIIGKGNTIDNVALAYPNGYFIEFYFSGFDPQFEGMDWESLKLVFEESNGIWYLVGIVHGQWTI